MEDFDPTEFRSWTRRNWGASAVISLVYLTFIYCAHRYMRLKKPFALDKPLVVWNGLLAVFSVLGTLSTCGEFFQSIRLTGFTGSFCLYGDYYKGITGFWLWLFTWSKVVELGDTVFLVLRKRPLIFLHVYHHVVTMLWVFYAYNHNLGSARWGVFMNLVVHSVMYSYFGLQALAKVLEKKWGYKVLMMPKWISMGITGMQIFQMLIGSYICLKVFSLVILEWDPTQPCQYEPTAAYWQLLMYLSYLLLFLHFFYRSYLSSDRQKGKTA